MQTRLKQSTERSTPFRRHLFKLLETDQAWTARQIRSRLDNVDLSTVYRNLKRLAQDSVLRDAGVSGEETYYELAKKDHHAHMVCENCDVAYCIPCPLPRIKEKHQLNVFGLCQKCQGTL